MFVVSFFEHHNFYEMEQNAIKFIFIYPTSSRFQPHSYKQNWEKNFSIIIWRELMRKEEEEGDEEEKFIFTIYAM